MHALVRVCVIALQRAALSVKASFLSFTVVKLYISHTQVNPEAVQVTPAMHQQTQIQSTANTYVAIEQDYHASNAKPMHAFMT